MGAILKTLGGYKDFWGDTRIFGIQLIARMARILRHLHPET